jgi:hypothetical protein
MKARDSAIQAQAAGTTEMSAATCEKSNILHDQVALSLFTMPPELIAIDNACEYVALQ